MFFNAEDSENANEDNEKSGENDGNENGEKQNGSDNARGADSVRSDEEITNRNNSGKSGKVSFSVGFRDVEESIRNFNGEDKNQIES